MTKDRALQMKAQAEELVKKARSGTPFSSLAKEFSKGPNADAGGDLGIVNPSLLLPEVASVLQKMNVGQISDPVISSAGIHIIHLIDRAQATGGDFEKMRPQIESKLYDERVKEELKNYLAELRKKTYVEIRD
jgi:peptidyl-prolyl cis-trans isomerase SurA